MVFVDEAVKKAECNAFFNAVYDNLYKREKGGRMIVVNDFLPPLFIQF